MNSSLGHILLVANPAAQSGAGAAAAERAAANLRTALGEDAVTVARTAGPRHACAIAEGAQGAQTVVALGGDGLIHEVVNGLMARPADDRPQLGVIPVGSGNDYARTLGVPAKVDRACDLLLSASSQPADVGCVNGGFFAETLSFGLDAAIAIDTMERRKRTGRHGAALYMASGFDQLFHHLDQREYRLQLDDGPVMEGKSITFAVQMGPYYGGGFRICPDARLDDGLLDVCISHPPITPAGAAAIFL
ncbi:MAG: YegS/Rv2252/BmrU family lipid kinase, partial [Senegalimassilia sp.]|nr:YegS/Rv2252/BmrU family lipid kinase [Senegalimassilia sp.]